MAHVSKSRHSHLQVQCCELSNVLSGRERCCHPLNSNDLSATSSGLGIQFYAELPHWLQSVTVRFTKFLLSAELVSRSPRNAVKFPSPLRLECVIVHAEIEVLLLCSKLRSYLLSYVSLGGIADGT